MPADILLPYQIPNGVADRRSLFTCQCFREMALVRMHPHANVVGVDHSNHPQ